MPPPDVLLTLLGDVRASSRALRQLRALAAAGRRLAVVDFGPPTPPGAPFAEGLPGVAHVALARPPGRGPRFFYAAHRAVAAALAGAPARLYLASDLYTLPAAVAAARRRGARAAYDARELYGALDDTHRRPWVGAVWLAVERRWAPRADLVLTVSDAIADRLAELHRIPRPLVVRNTFAAPPGPPPAPLDLARAFGVPADHRVVLYQGLLREGRGLPALVDAVAAVDGAALVVVGSGPLEDALRARAAPLGARVRFAGFVPPDALPALTAAADLGALLIEPLTESLRLSLPNKLFEYLAAGLPVLGGPGPDLRRVVEGFDVGLTVARPGDAAEVAAALRPALFDEEARARWRANVPAALAAHRWEDDAARLVDAVGRRLDG